MAGHIIGDLVMAYCQLDIKKQFRMKYQSKYPSFLLQNCLCKCLPCNVTRFIRAQHIYIIAVYRVQ